MSESLLKVPRDPLFINLYHRWSTSPSTVIIRDGMKKTQSTVENFLFHITTLRNHIYEALDEGTRSQLRCAEHDVHIGVIATPEYETTALIFAIHSLGAVVVPISYNAHPKEIRYFLHTCGASLLTFNAGAAEVERLSEQIEVKVFVPEFPLPSSAPSFTLEAGSSLDSNPQRGYALLWTSGTTGPPKGVLLSRRAAYTGYQQFVEALNLTEKDYWLHNMHFYWAWGWTALHSCILAGTCLELCGAKFTPELFWRRMQQGGISCVNASQETLVSLAKYLPTMQNSWTQEEYDAAIRGLRDLRVFIGGAMRVTESVKSLWNDLRDGRLLGVTYGATEFAAPMAVTDWRSNESIPPNCCGYPMKGLSVKITEKGEICLRSNAMFTKYISVKKDVNSDVFDSEGYFKTGDLGKYEDGQLYVLGRQSSDVIRFRGMRVFAPEIEDLLNEHPSVSQSIVVGVDDIQAEEMVAALLVVHKEADISSLNLRSLRHWLTVEKDLPCFKLPTMLRCVTTECALPVTASGKPVKKKIKDQFFLHNETAKRNTETWDFASDANGTVSKPWDWEGTL